MVAPLIAAALIGGGATILGGALSNRSAKSQAAQQEALQREFAQNSIQWKTADAKAAGLHPLYAMGSVPTPYSPTTYSDSMGPALASAGQSIARGYAANQAQQNTDRQYNKSVSDSNFMRKMAQDQMILNQQRLQAEITGQNMDNTLRQMEISATARALQNGNSQQDLEVPGITQEGTPMVGGLIQEIPNEIPSARKGADYITAGVSPGWREVNLGPFKAITPWSEEGWGEDLNLTKLAIIAMATTAHYSYNVAKDDIGPFIRKNYKKLQADFKYRKNLKKIGRAMADQNKINRIEGFGLGQPRPRR